MKKYETQSLALDGCSQVSLCLSPECLLDQGSPNWSLCAPGEGGIMNSFQQVIWFLSNLALRIPIS